METRPATFAALRERNFAIMWSANALSNIGSWLQLLAVPVVIYSITGSGTWLGIAGFFGYIPMTLAGPYAGSIADRFQRRKVLLVGSVVQLFVAGCLWLLWTSGQREVIFYILVMAVGSVVGGLTVASWQSFVADLVPRSLLQNAIVLNTTQYNVARAIGPTLGGVILATLGVGWCFAINSLSYLAITLALTVVHVANRTRDTGDGRARPIREMLEAVRELRRIPGIVTCFTIVPSLGAVNGPLFSLLVVFADDVYHLDRTGYGLLAGCLGFGAVATSPFVAGPGSRVRRSRMVSRAMVGYGAALVLLGAASTPLVGGLGLLVAGSCFLMVSSTLNTTLQLQVPEEMRGRAMAGYVAVFTLGIPFGSLVQGWMVDIVGVRWTVAGAGVVILATWFVVRWVIGRLPTLDGDQQHSSSPALI